MKALLRDMASLLVMEQSKELLLWEGHRGFVVQLRTALDLHEPTQVAARQCAGIDGASERPCVCVQVHELRKTCGIPTGAPSCCHVIVKQCHRRFPLVFLGVAAQRCSVTVVPKHATVSCGVITRRPKDMEIQNTAIVLPIGQGALLSSGHATSPCS